MNEQTEQQRLEAILSYAVLSIALRKIYDGDWPDRGRLGLNLQFGYTADLLSGVGQRVCT